MKREKAYSVIEKECLAIIWAVQKFEPYLYGNEFDLETDHQSLVYMQRTKVANNRVMRWALALQPYRFRLVSIKGSENIGADVLSRFVSLCENYFHTLELKMKEFVICKQSNSLENCANN